jgi:carbon storage regulator
MLILSRKAGEQIVVGDTVHVTVLAICRDRVRLGIAAPREVPIVREELRISRGSNCGAGFCRRGARAFACE